MMSFSQSPYWNAATGLPDTVFAGQTLAIVDKSSHFLGDGDSPDFGQQNLGLHVGDDAITVQQHRINLLQHLKLFGAKQLYWLNQTHSTIAYIIDEHVYPQLMDGDGLVTHQQGIALMMMTADCLPIVVSNEQGDEVACIHAGWRGLANGVIEATINKMQSSPAFAWIGAAISQSHFEVGREVRETFIKINKEYEQDFIAKENGKYLADLYSIAIKKLITLGVQSVSGAERCSFAEQDQYYSYRRNSKTGRMATFIFISTKDDKLD